MAYDLEREEWKQEGVPLATADSSAAHNEAVVVVATTAQHEAPITMGAPREKEVAERAIS